MGLPSYWVIYFFYSILAIYVIILVVTKIHSPFWFHQPIFHTYELYPRLLWKKKPYWKRRRTVKYGIFCDTKNIETWELNDFTHWTALCKLLQGYYVDNDYALFHCSQKYLLQCLHGNSVISCYREKRFIEPDSLTKMETPITKWLEEPIYDTFFGCIVSCPVWIYFALYPEESVEIHAWNLLCVHDLYKEKNLSRSLIQTHIYNHCTNGSSFSGGYCFVKHGEKCRGVVPLLSYSIFTFVLKKVRFHKLPRNYRIYCLNRNHIDLWRAIYVQMIEQFEVSIMPSFEYTVEWLTNEKYSIYATVYKIEKVEHIHGVYFFEHTRKSWLDDTIAYTDVIRLTGSVLFTGIHPKHDLRGIVFFRGFVNCLQEYLLGEGKSSRKGVLEIPSYSYNLLLLDKWREKYELHAKTDSSFYLYNLVYPSSPILPEKFIALC